MQTKAVLRTVGTVGLLAFGAPQGTDLDAGQRPTTTPIQIEVARVDYGDGCTIGHMLVNGRFIGYTLELPWHQNLENISAIPPNAYPLNPYETTVRTDGPLRWRLEVPASGPGAVPGRNLVQIHMGNYPADTKGCILLGKRLVPGRCQLQDSGAALNDLRSVLGEPTQPTPVKLRVFGSPPEQLVPPGSGPRIVDVVRRGERNIPVPAAGSGQRPASAALRAVGGPIVDCAGARNTSAHLGSGLGVINEAIRRAEAQIEGAREARAAANAAAQAALLDELQGTVAQYVASADIIQQHLVARRGTALSLGEIEALKEIERLKASADQTLQGLRALVAVQDHQYRTQILKKTTPTLVENIARANKLFIESGLAEQLGEGLAGAAGGPLGEAAFKIAKLGIDVTANLVGEALSTAEYQQARAHLDIMQGQRSLLNARIERLDGLFRDNCTTTQAETNLTPPPPDPPTPPAKKGGAGKTIGILGVAAGGGLGFALYCKQNPDKCGGGNDPDTRCDTNEGNRLRQRLQQCVSARNCSQTTIYSDYDRWCRSCGYSRFDVGLSGCR